jgi:hypothetical protein
MKAWTLARQLITLTAIALFLLGARVAYGQDQQPSSDDSTKPKSAARSIPAAQDSDQDDSDTGTLQPDTRPLTGVQTPNLGAPEIGHSYFVPGIQLMETARTVSLGEATGADWSSSSFVAGSMSLYNVTNRSELSANYTGGGYFSSDGAQGTGMFHQLGVTQTFKWKRWQLSLIDQFSYLPESAFGFGVGTGFSVPGISGILAPTLPELQGNLQPNQTAFTANGTRYSNSAATELVYKFRRSSINLSGTYAILRFLEPGNINTDMDNLNFGYDYQLSGKSSIGVVYRLTEYHFLDTPQALTDHAFHFAYGRKITGRLALQLFGGPDLAMFRQPIGNQSQRLSPSYGATFDYAMPRTDVVLAYNHGVSNGGGVLIGADTDQITLEVDQHINRRWQGTISFGFARNNGLGDFSNVLQQGENFDSYVIGGALNHALARDANLTMAYSSRIQISTQNLCTAGSCGAGYTQHQLSVALSWHARPFVMR